MSLEGEVAPIELDSMVATGKPRCGAMAISWNSEREKISGGACKEGSCEGHGSAEVSRRWQGEAGA